MELIYYLDADLKEQGVIENADFDSEIGGQYDFVLKCAKRDYGKLANGYVYPRGAFEFGGKIEYCIINSDDGLVEFHGLTWLGLLAKHELSNISYTNASGTLAKYLQTILEAVGIEKSGSTTHTMWTNTTANNVSVSNRAYNGEIFTAYEELRRVYDAFGLLPTVAPSFTGDRLTVMLGSRTPSTYNDFDFSGDVLPLEIEKHYDPVTKITLRYDANGTLQGYKRAYMEETGTWIFPDEAVTPQYGLKTRSKTLIVSQEEYNAPDWNAIIASVQTQDAAVVRVAGELQPDVGDTVTGRDPTTGVSATAKVTSKTLHITDGVAIFSFDTDKGE